MSDGTHLPGGVMTLISENGYESPQELLPDSSNSTAIAQLNADYIRRHTFTSTEKTPNDGPSFAKEEECSHTQKDNDNLPAIKKIGLRERIGCFTWTWFTMTMATGGIAHCLHAIPFRSEWLTIIGTIFFFLNICLFLFNCTMITLRFRFNPGSFRTSFTNQSESLFIPACIVSVGIICITICEYGIAKTGVWLQSTMQVIFWLYVTVAMMASCGIYLMLWSTQAFPIHTMTPIWVFPAYPLLLAAPFAANLIDNLPSTVEAERINALAITLGAITVQGTGFCVSFMIYGAFIYRLMTQKLPREPLRPGIFVSIGPCGFTTAGLVHLGNIVSSKVLPNGYLGDMDAAFILKLISDLVGLWLWGLCIWFFLISVGTHWEIFWPSNGRGRITYNMTWFSYVFPNTAFVTATQAIGISFSARPIQIVATVMSAMLIVVWMIVIYHMLRALWLRKLLWPEEVKGDGQGDIGNRVQDSATR